MTADPFLTMADLAKLYQVHLRTARRWAAQDHWRRTMGKPVRYSVADAQRSYEKRHHGRVERHLTMKYRDQVPSSRPGRKHPIVDLWIVIVEDRHADSDALPFSTEERAIEYAREQVQANARHPEYIEEQELNSAMQQDGWVFYATYSTESDCIRVVKRTLDAEP